MEKTKKKTRKKLRSLTIPKVIRSKEVGGLIEGFPVNHYSYSSWTKFSSDPFMFKVNYLNGDSIETTSSASNVLGKAVHVALGAYLGGADEPTPADEGEAIKFGHNKGLEFLKSYSDGFIKFDVKGITNRTILEEKYAFCYFGYIKEFAYEKEVKEIIVVEKMLKHKVEVDGKVLPIPLKGSADLVYRDFQNRIKIRDHKITKAYSKEDAIDGGKLIQACFNYFLVYAEIGEAPYSMTYAEFKHTNNQDHTPQMEEYEIVFSETPLMFELFYRLYGDVTDALLGNQVFIPNVYAMYDKEVSLLAYIHRLDIEEVRAEEFKKLKVDNITDFLKKKIQKIGSMKKYLDVVNQKFVSATTLNYKDMTLEEKIKMKLAEHGLGVEFYSKVTGNSVVLYRYEASIGLKMSKIEAYVKDIEQVVETSGIRVLAPIPDSGLIGFEVPLKNRTFPSSLIAPDGFNMAIGVDVMGETVRMDIREAPHMLVAGATGSGKSIFISKLISQLQSLPRTNVELVLLDPKMVELSKFQEGNVYADELMEISDQLESLVAEMNRRYKKLQEKKVKNLAEYRAQGGRFPYIFVVIDEYGDLITQTATIKMADEKVKVSSIIKKNILLLSQKARAAGIHIILTTQRPSVKIVDGDIKANFPTRIAFKTSTAIDSLVIIDQAGAEKLLGKGDMLFQNPFHIGLQRLQGFL